MKAIPHTNHSYTNCTMTIPTENVYLKTKHRCIKTYYATWGFKPGLYAFNLTRIPSVPCKTNGVNKHNPHPLKLQHQQRQRHIEVNQAKSTYRQCTP